MLLVLLCLVSVAWLAGLTDSVMSPYLCPVISQHGDGDTLCGLVISARFLTHIISILVLGQLISRVGAGTMFLISVGVCGVFNMLLASVVWIEDDRIFTVITFLVVILSMIGDAGVFCSIYVLAGRTSASVLRSEDSPSEDMDNPVKDMDMDSPITDMDMDSRNEGESKRKAKQMNASGPAWVETLYGCGSMLGPPLGGVIYVAAGFGGVILTIGGCMAVTSLITAVVFHTKVKRTKECRLEFTVHDESTGEVVEAVGEVSPISKEESDDASDELSYLSAVCRPPVAMCCLLQVNSGLASSWYLSSLQHYLSSHVSLSTEHIGLVYMSQSLVYTLLTPAIGLLLDRGWPRLPLLYASLAANVAGYLLLGPSVLLQAEPSLAWSVSGLVAIGLGQATALITCLNLMMNLNHSTSTENNAGKITSLWECCEMVGGYLGSTFGGITTDAYGFRMSTTIVSGVNIVMMVVLTLFNVVYVCLRGNKLRTTTM